jgi:membrane protease YdiL (CAAX protease family)
VIRIVLDFLVLVVAVVCAVLAENFAMARVFGIPAYAVRFGGRPGIWISRFLEPLVALPILTLWLWRNGETWHKLGLLKPTSWARFARHVIATLLGLGALIYVFTHAVIYPFHFRTASSPYIGTVPTLVAALSYYLLGTGLDQELSMRGFLQNRIAKAFGAGPKALHGAIATTGVVFGAGHLQLGPANAVMAGLAGVFLGVMYIWADRNLWVVVVAHSLVNAALLIGFHIYG